MKLLVIGAGYVGMALLKSLKNFAHEIYVTTTDPEKVNALKEYAKEVILLKTPEDLKKALLLCDSCALLLAPKKGVSYEDTYLHTAKIISSFLEEKKTHFYLVYTSSSSVYEGIKEEFATEELTLSPTSEKAKILLETETLLLGSSTTCILRLGGIFGPNREISKRALALQGKEMAGSGEEPTNHIHVTDIVKAILFCLEKKLNGIYNLVNDDHPKRNELYSCHWNTALTSLSKGYKVSNKKIRSAGFPFPLKSIDLKIT